MIQDPTNQYIAAILAAYDLTGKAVLEVGCGKGRITRDLADHAWRVLASDPDLQALEVARKTVAADNVTFIHAPSGLPEGCSEIFDAVIYTLSLHHVQESEMSRSLAGAAELLRPDGVIMVLEPADGGSFTEAKERFGAGSGDERAARRAAIRAMDEMPGWTAGETRRFTTLFQFDDDQDFFSNLLPQGNNKPAFLQEVTQFLHLHRTDTGITLDAKRRLNVLRRS